MTYAERPAGRVDLVATGHAEVRAGLNWTLENAHPLLMAVGPMRVEIEHLRRAVSEALGIHMPWRCEDDGAQYCKSCGHLNDPEPWPCDTVRALTRPGRAPTA